MKLFLTTIIIMLAYLPTLDAKMYKWVDADGKTNYTAYPPPDGSGKEIKAPPPPATAVSKTDENKNSTGKEDGKKKNKKVHPEVIKAKKSLCKEAKNNLKSLQESRRHVFRDSETNELIYYDDKKMAARTKEANDTIKEYCK